MIDSHFENQSPVTQRPATPIETTMMGPARSTVVRNALLVLLLSVDGSTFGGDSSIMFNSRPRCLFGGATCSTTLLHKVNHLAKYSRSRTTGMRGSRVTRSISGMVYHRIWVESLSPEQGSLGRWTRCGRIWRDTGSFQLLDQCCVSSNGSQHSFESGTRTCGRYER
jgi:hypothetical protein